MTAPAGGLGQSSTDHFVSEPLRAPKRFNIVGFTWTGGAKPALAVRVRQAGEGWHAWTPVPTSPDGGPDPGGSEQDPQGASPPIWAGQADYVQYRFSKRPSDLQLHFVNTTGTASTVDRAENAVRNVVHDGVVAVAGLTSAEAGGERPDMIRRDEWGAQDCLPLGTPDYGSVKLAFIHHTVTANSYSRDDARAMVLGICRYHRDTNGWDDIGYNFLVDKYGQIFEGRAGGVGEAVVGAQAQGFNAQSTGIANLGTFSSIPQTNAALRAMARLIRWKLTHHGEPTSGRVTVTSAGGSQNRYPAGTEVRLSRVSGHRKADYTECPGNALNDQLHELRRRVG